VEKLIHKKREIFYAVDHMARAKKTSGNCTMCKIQWLRSV